MPAANAREKLTQASPYGRARCIDRLLRCTSSTLARGNLTPAQPRRTPSSSYRCFSCKTLPQPSLLAPCASAAGLSPSGLREYTRFNVITPTICAARRDATRRDATLYDAGRHSGYATRAALPLIGMRECYDLRYHGLYLSFSFSPSSHPLSLSLSLSFACAPRISSKTDRYASNA